MLDPYILIQYNRMRHRMRIENNLMNYAGEIETATEILSDAPGLQKERDLHWRNEENGPRYELERDREVYEA